MFFAGAPLKSSVYPATLWASRCGQSAQHQDNSCRQSSTDCDSPNKPRHQVESPSRCTATSNEPGTAPLQPRTTTNTPLQLVDTLAVFNTSKFHLMQFPQESKVIRYFRYAREQYRDHGPTELDTCRHQRPEFNDLPAPHTVRPNKHRRRAHLRNRFLDCILKPLSGPNLLLVNPGLQPSLAELVTHFGHFAFVFAIMGQKHIEVLITHTIRRFCDDSPFRTPNIPQVPRLEHTACRRIPAAAS